MIVGLTVEREYAIVDRLAHHRQTRQNHRPTGVRHGRNNDFSRNNIIMPSGDMNSERKGLRSSCGVMHQCSRATWG
jgi:hypothetical protein